MRRMLRVTMLVWCSAMLLAAPLFAAVDCHACCSEQRQQVQPSTCPHCPTHPASDVVVCHHEPTPDNDCGTPCPRCERSRPVPFDRAANAESLVPPVLWMAWWPLDAVWPLSLSPTAEDVAAAGIVPGGRTACVHYHRWLV